MQVDSRQLQDDPRSHCWSFGSINHPSSQSRKISVGVMVDSLPKKTTEVSKPGDIAELYAERVKSNVRNSAKGKSKIEEMTATKKTKQTESIGPMNSPWISTRTFNAKATTSETVLCPERITNLPASGRQCKFDGAKSAALSYSVQVFANGTSVVQSNDDKRNKFNGVTYERKGRKDKMTDKEQEFTFATVQHALMSDKEVIEDKINKTEKGRTENLRLKLQEILGTVSSPNGQYSKSLTRELGAESLNPEQNFDQIGDAVAEHRQSSDKREQNFSKMGDTLSKPRQNSDTIETDSDCPDNRLGRPVTRSFTRKRAPTKAQTKTTKSGQSSRYQLKRQEKNIYCTKDGFPKRLQASVSGGSSMLARKKIEKKNARVEPRNFFDESHIKDKIQPVTRTSETPLPSQKASSLGNKRRDFLGCIDEKEKDCLGIEKNISKNNSHNSPLPNNRDNQYGVFDSPENRDQQDDIGTPSVRNVVNPQGWLQSPTFGINTPVSSSSLSSMAKTDEMGELHGFRNLQRKNLDYYDDDDEEERKDSPTRKASPNIEEKDAEARLSESSSDDRHLEMSEEGSPMSDEYDRSRERDTFFPQTNAAKKLKFMLRPAERLRNHEINVQSNDMDKRSPSIKGNGESNWIAEPSAHNQVDGLARALELFAMELEKLKSKIKSATNKKSSEILMSVAEDIHLRLQNVESQIQTDMGKVKNVGKLKRKQMETRFGEQQEQLQLIYEKFKEQINQHLQDCKSTFEELEGDQLEFKGTMEKRKTSHRKLLLQVEEAIETHLNDAQRRITATHQLARGKMLQLKQIVALCLKEGTMS